MTQATDSFSGLFQLNGETPTTNIWQVKTTLLNNIVELSNLPITAPQDEQLTFRAKFLEFIYKNCVDTLYGGLIYQANQESNSIEKICFKPLDLNVLIADLLLDADRFFYTGQLNHIALKIINYFCQQLANSNTGLIEFQEEFTTSELPCFFTMEYLNSRLSLEEKTLLLTLAEKNSTINKKLDGIIYCQSKSLKQAADEIGMQYKLAQIFEYSIQIKLAVDSNQKPTHLKTLICPFVSNCQLLILLSKGYLYSNIIEMVKISNDLFENLTKYSLSDNLNQEELVNLALAGFHYLQVKFDNSILKELAFCLDKLSDATPSYNEDNQSLFEKQTLSQIIEAFCQKNLLDLKYAQLAKEIIPERKDFWTIEWLQKTQIDLDNQLVSIRAKFSPYRLIYII